MKRYYEFRLWPLSKRERIIKELDFTLNDPLTPRWCQLVSQLDMIDGYQPLILINTCDGQACVKRTAIIKA